MIKTSASFGSVIIATLTVCLSLYFVGIGWERHVHAADPAVTTQKKAEVTNVPAVLAPDASLVYPQNIAGLAKSLADKTGKSILVIAPQPDVLVKNLKDLDVGGKDVSKISWEALQSKLRSAGAIPIIFAHTNTIAVVQGKVYPTLLGASTSTLDNTLWHQFYSSYRSLTASQKLALGSPNGLVVSADATSVPEAVKGLMPSIFDPSLSKPARVRLRLSTSLETCFTDAPKGLASGYWSWSQARTGAPVSFPLDILLSPSRTYSWSANPIHINSDASLKASTTALIKATGGEVRFSDKVQWPMIAAVGSVAASDMLTCLNIAGIADAHYLSAEHLLYVGPASNVNRFLPRASIPDNEVDAYNSLVDTAARAGGSDFGPLLYGVLQFPTASLGNMWTNSILSDIPPDIAIEQAQSSQPNHEVSGDAPLGVWTKTYSTSSMFSYSGLVLVGLREKRLSAHPGEWYISSANNLNISRFGF